MIVDKDTIDEILQRPLNYARQSELAQYLAARKQHKFPPVLVVISQDWVDQLDSDEWDADGRAVISAARFSPLDSHGRYGLLDLSSDMRIFALDGQHRLLGVQGLIELVRKGKLVVLDKRGKQKAGREITADALSERYGITLLTCKLWPARELALSLSPLLFLGKLALKQSAESAPSLSTLTVWQRRSRRANCTNWTRTVVLHW